MRKLIKISIILFVLTGLLFLINISSDDSLRNYTNFTEISSLDGLSETVSTLNTASNLDSSDTYASKRLIVLSDTSDFNAYGADVVLYDNMYILSYKTKEDCKKAYTYLKFNRKIKSVEFDSVLELEIINGLDTSTKTDRFQSTPLANSNIKIAILDSGIDTSNPLFNDRVIDLGINLSTSGNSKSIQDDNGHGTAVASVIAEYSNATLVPIKIADKNGRGTVISLYSAIKLAIENDVDIINLSLVTTPNSALLSSVINECEAKGITVVAAAGNYSANVENYTPANIESVITVAATDKDYYPASYSNYGELIDYAALGSFYDMDGTSLASAYVSAVLAYSKESGVDFNKFVYSKGENIYYGKGVVSLEDIDLPDVSNSWDLGFDFKIKQSVIDSTDNIYKIEVLTNEAVEYTFDGGITWQKENYIDIDGDLEFYDASEYLSSVKTIGIKGDNNDIRYKDYIIVDYKPIKAEQQEINLAAESISTVTSASGTDARYDPNANNANQDVFYFSYEIGDTATTSQNDSNIAVVTKYQCFGTGNTVNYPSTVKIKYNSKTYVLKVKEIGNGTSTSFYPNSVTVNKVNIPNSVVKLNDYALYNLASVKEVILGTGVTQFYKNTFRGTTLIDTLTISSNIESHGDAFVDYDSLKNLIINSGSTKCTVIPENIFKNCSNLSNVTINNSAITEVGAYAFYGCTSLTSRNAFDYAAFDTSLTGDVGKFAFKFGGLSQEGTTAGKPTVNISDATEQTVNYYPDTRIGKVTMSISADSAQAIDGSDFVICLDVTGSMDDHSFCSVCGNAWASTHTGNCGGVSKNRWVITKEIVSQFVVDTIASNPKNRIALVIFTSMDSDGNTKKDKNIGAVCVDFTSDTSILTTKISGLKMDSRNDGAILSAENSSGSYGTNYKRGLIAAMDLVQTRGASATTTKDSFTFGATGRADAPVNLIFISDGEANSEQNQVDEWGKVIKGLFDNVWSIGVCVGVSGGTTQYLEYLNTDLNGESLFTDVPSADFIDTLGKVMESVIRLSKSSIFDIELTGTLDTDKWEFYKPSGNTDYKWSSSLSYSGSSVCTKIDLLDDSTLSYDFFIKLKESYRDTISSAGTINIPVLTKLKADYKISGGEYANTDDSTEKICSSTLPWYAYTVSYNGNGHTEGSTESQVKIGGKTLYLKSNNFKKTDYRFSNWNTKADGTGVSYSSGAGYNINENITLYAQWKPGEYTVYYNGNGANSGSVAFHEFNRDESITIRENGFVKDGYVFAGWNTSPSGTGTSYNVGESYVLNKSVYLYAQWSKLHSLTVQPNGGTWDNTTEDSVFWLLENEEKSIPTPTREGYIFTGWTMTDVQNYPDTLTINYNKYKLLDTNYNDTGDALYIMDSGYLCEDFIDEDEISDTVSYIGSELYYYLSNIGDTLHSKDLRVKLVEIDGENVYAFALSKDEVEHYKDNLRDFYYDYVYDEETGELLPRYIDMWTRTLGIGTIIDLPQKPESEPEKPTYEKVVPQCSCNGSHSYTSLSLEVDNDNRLYYECLNGHKTYIIRDYKDLNCPVCNYDDDLHLSDDNVYSCKYRQHDCIFLNCTECNSPNTVVNYDNNDKLVIVECSDCSIEYVYSLKQICGVCNNDSSLEETCSSCGSNNFRGDSNYCLICRRNVRKELSCSKHDVTWMINVLSDVISSQKIADDYYIYCNDCGKMYFKCNDNDSRYFYGNEGIYCPTHDDIDCLVCINCSSTDIRKEKKEYTSFYCLNCKSSDYIKDYQWSSLDVICDRCDNFKNIILLAESNNSCIKAYYFNECGEIELLPLADNDSTHMVPAFVYGKIENIGNMTSLTEEATFTMGEVDIILTANWEEIPKYYVTYNSNGADTEQIVSKWFYEGTAHKICQNMFSKEGYVFTGWNTESDGTGTAYNVGSSYDTHEDLSLFAQWRISKSTLIIEPNGGTWNNYTTQQKYIQEWNTTLDIPIPTWKGYIFTGWARNGNFGSITSLTEDATYTFGPYDDVTEVLTAKWKAIEYDIQYKEGLTDG